ncbi:MAG: hypothetical protein RR053_05320 [Evtepia sp.]
MRAIQNWLDRFAYKHPRFGIPNLMRYIVLGNVLVFLLDQFSVGGGAACSNLLSFSAPLILKGQIWRLISFVFVPQGGGLFWVAVSLYFYYFIGNALEQEWGAGKFTLFYSLGIVFNIIIGMITGYASMQYINLSMFFSFATLYPNLQFLLFFIIPIKAKWMAWLDGAVFAFSVFQYLFSPTPILALLPLVAILNYFLFFGADLLDQFGYFKKKVAHKTNPKTINFKDAQAHVREKNGYLHKCAVCGRTDVSDPTLEFRYCSKCNGYYCYCIDHINSHVHVK